MTSVPPAQPPAAPETDVSALVGDDVDYWLNNPFMTPDLLSEKVRYWVTQATAATTARAESAEAAHRALVARLEAFIASHDNENWRGWGIPQALRALLAGGEER